MIGFSPYVSTEHNLKHGNKLIQECDHPTVRQIQEWWQDRNTYYAFESHEGALWWGKHGGPKKFCTLLASKLPYKPPPKISSPLGIELKCYSCEEHLENMHKNMSFKIHRCPCGSKFTHKKCFMPNTCPVCGTDYAITTHETTIASKIA